GSHEKQPFRQAFICRLGERMLGEVKALKMMFPLIHEPMSQGAGFDLTYPLLLHFKVEGALPLFDCPDKVLILQSHDQNQVLVVPVRGRRNVDGDLRITVELSVLYRRLSEKLSIRHHTVFHRS
ncbi:hypothetical protein HAX54_053359, partial [Datura stramonium]|nr:hypothetical protein [Datura stramonium]